MRTVFVLIFLLLTSCAFNAQVASSAVDYNRSVAEAHNSVLALNVVRAMYRHPMYFTGLSKITGSIKGSAELGAGTEFGQDATKKTGLTSGVGVSGGPVFDLAVLDSQAFMRGIMTPMSAKTLKYFLDQGWPADLVFHLAIRELRTSRGVLYVNSPLHPTYKHFRAWVARWSKGAVRLESEPMLKGYGPPISAIGSLRDAAAGLTANIDLENTSGNNWQIQYAQERYNLVRTEFVNKQQRQSKLVAEVGASIPTGVPNPDQFPLEALRSDSSKPEGVKLILRSPEAMLFYLGELAREWSKKRPRNVPHVTRDGKLQPLFALRSVQRLRGDLIVEVDYEGHTFGISTSDKEAGLSMHCLSFVSQLLALHKASKDLPTTGTVQLVGQ